MKKVLQTTFAAAAFSTLLLHQANAQIDLSFPATPNPDTTQAGKPYLRSSLNGIITASGFVQDGTFGLGNGAITMWANPKQPTQDEYQFGGDLRKTWLIFKGTAYNLPHGITATGRAELDFLGGTAGGGGFADENLLPRVRLAYVEVQKGQTRMRLGQNWTPMVAHFPNSVTHFAMGYGSAGGIGFRNPGLFLYQGLTSQTAATKVRLDLAVFRGSWTGPKAEADGRDEGEIGVPQTEIGLNISNQNMPLKWEVNLAGHYDRKRLVHADERHNLEGKAIQAGTKLTLGGATLQGNAYWGRAIGQSWGQLLQFGDIEGYGAWGQAGYKFGKHFSAWVLYGQDNPNDTDVLAEVTGNARLKNEIIVPMLRYDIGPLGIALEWYRANTDWRLLENGQEVYKTTSANQLALGAQFVF
ncbi:hypothetical protein [Pontibacter pudoricolor]|uniref:hypothetical protein n=1 Tax=Pontibacter pudoricolor TaxID=2694930 RepID=UPI001391FAC3|nr:hypothetical protein [Pontibacter pudoricolor]